VGAMTAIVPILYEAKKYSTRIVGWDPSFFIFAGAGISVFLKMMTLRDRNVWLACMLLFYVISFFLLAK
jgi:hypothetical protein